MKPRFSILTLLGFTAYVAVNVMAFVQPSSLWPYTAFTLAAVLLVLAIPVACSRTTDSAVFCRGLLLVTLVYGCLRSWEPNGFMLPGYFGWPYEYFVRQELDGSASTDVQATEMLNRATIAQFNFQLSVGLLGGLATLWHYRHQQRKQEAPPQV